MKRKKVVIILLMLVILITSYLSCIRLFSAKEYSVEGKIKDIYIGGVNDIILILENDSKRYYINRGLEKGLTKELLINQLGSRIIQITTKSEGLNLLDLDDSLKEVKKIAINDSIYYTENF